MTQEQVLQSNDLTMLRKMKRLKGMKVFVESNVKKELTELSELQIIKLSFGDTLPSFFKKLIDTILTANAQTKFNLAWELAIPLSNKPYTKAYLLYILSVKEEISVLEKQRKELYSNTSIFNLPTVNGKKLNKLIKFTQNKVITQLVSERSFVNKKLHEKNSILQGVSLGSFINFSYKHSKEYEQLMKMTADYQKKLKESK